MANLLHFMLVLTFLCMSEHEGFCVPLVEAMCNELPIVSSNGGAIGETLNGAGILLDVDSDLIDYVAAIDLAVNNKIVRSELIESSKKSAKILDLDLETKRAVDWLTFSGEFSKSKGSQLCLNIVLQLLNIQLLVIMVLL